MSNNYRNFSFALKLNDEPEVSWFRSRLIMAMNEEDNDGNPGHDFDATVYPEGDNKDKYVWFRDNGEGGNLEQIADIVQEYLKQFNKKGYLVITWADYCDKHRLDEFGGGVALVTAKKTHWFNESKWITGLAKGLNDAGVHR